LQRVVNGCQTAGRAGSLATFFEVMEMDRTLSFRRSLLARLVGTTAITMPLAAVGAGACGGGVAGGGGATTTPMTACVPWPPAPLTGGGSPPSADTCPPASDVAVGACTTVMGDGKFANGQCCYQVVQSSCALTGRPWLDAGH
jgi:hypothetical protein